MTTHRQWCSIALLILASSAARAADTDASLPPGARARLGTGPFVVDKRDRSGFYPLPPSFGTFLVGGGINTGPRLYDAVTGKATVVPGFAQEPPGRPPNPRRFNVTHAIRAVSADGKRAVTEWDRDTYLVFEIATGKEVGKIAHEPVATPPVSLSADGKVLAVDSSGPGETREVAVWNVDGNVRLTRVTGLKGQNVRVVLAPDGATLVTMTVGFPNPATAFLDPTVTQLWSTASGKPTATLPYDYTGGPIAFSPDGKTLATADAACGTVQLWDAATGKPGALLLGRAAALGPMTFSPNGKTLAALARDGTVVRWALSDGKLLKPTPFPAADLLPYWNFFNAIGLSFVDNERAVACGAVGTAMLLWSVPDGRVLTPTTGHLGEVLTVRFTADGKQVLTAGTDRRVLRWDAATGRRLEVVTDPTRQSPFDPAESSPYRHLSPDGTRGLRHQSLYSVADGEELLGLPVLDAIPSHDFRRAAGLGRTRAGRPATYDVWDLVNYRRVAQLEAPAGTQLPDGAVAFSPDASRLVAAVPVPEPGRAPRPVLVVGWDVGTGKRLGEVRVPAQNLGNGDAARPHLALASNGARVVLATADGALWAADYERGDRGEAVTELARSAQRFAHPTFSPDGKTFAVAVPATGAEGYEIQVYDWPRGKRLHTFTGQRRSVTALAFAPDGKLLASGSSDGTVLLWDMTAVPAPK